MGTVKGLTVTGLPFWSRNVPHGGRKAGGGFVFATGPAWGPKVQKGATTRGPASWKLKPRKEVEPPVKKRSLIGSRRSASSITPLPLRSGGLRTFATPSCTLAASTVTRKRLPA